MCVEEGSCVGGGYVCVEEGSCVGGEDARQSGMPMASTPPDIRAPLSLTHFPHPSPAPSNL